ncbi:protein disulfide-isomerase isoform X2 [Nerophis ophidion]|uniref:protein disulfide-isomerase isoform X2 n=1 Tax=Nerophis ophidion TaxID=159077 RepID=UPI002ADFC69D|nr:protein disulfide-isomerase isoform X2 [Nerophis ophidion]
MLSGLFFLVLLASPAMAGEQDGTLPRLADGKAAQAFIQSAEVVVIGFLQADNHQENLVVAEAKKLETDGLVNFVVVNEVRYLTEYSQVTAVGIFNSEVKAHLLLFVNRSSKEQQELKKRLAALAPEFMGKFLFVLINGEATSNSRSLQYFGLRPQDLPRVGIYDRDSDMKWLLPPGPISTERVREFCTSFLLGELKAMFSGPNKKIWWAGCGLRTARWLMITYILWSIMRTCNKLAQREKRSCEANKRCVNDFELLFKMELKTNKQKKKFWRILCRGKTLAQLHVLPRRVLVLSLLFQPAATTRQWPQGRLAALVCLPADVMLSTATRPPEEEGT